MQFTLLEIMSVMLSPFKVVFDCSEVTFNCNFDDKNLQSELHNLTASNFFFVSIHRSEKLPVPTQTPTSP